MWSYYGSKSKIVDLYPKPQFTEIIEPFAGSARYALKYFEHDVTLVDKYEVVIKVWKWLQQCSPKDILGLPVLTQGLDIRTLNLSESESLFLRMNAGAANTMPRNKVSYFAAEQNGRVNKYKNIANSLYKIKHWKIVHGSYLDIKNRSATWFIDPPYQFGGQAYVENKIHFGALGYWCKQRLGQAIVCENTKANWLPFVPIKQIRSIHAQATTEAIYTNYHTHYNNIQQTIF